MKLLVVCGMSDNKVRARLEPLVKIKEIKEIFLVRRKPINIPKVVSISPPTFLRKLIFLAEIYRIISILYICISQSPDVLYSIYFIPHGIYVSIFGFLFKNRVIHELIGTDRPKVMNSKLLLEMISQAEKIAVRGQKSFNALSEIGINEEKLFISISVNVLDFGHFKPYKGKKIYDLVYCGRMDENKHLEIIIRAIANVKEDLPMVKALFIGDGPRKESLEKLKDALNLNSTLDFIGYQPYQEIPYYLNKSKIFIMSSAFEGLPMAMLEAFSCGLPVIVPNVGDITDVARHKENALIIESSSVEEYSQSIKLLLKNDLCYQRLCYGAYETRENLKDKFNLEKAKKTWKTILLRES